MNDEKRKTIDAALQSAVERLELDSKPSGFEVDAREAARALSETQSRTLRTGARLGACFRSALKIGEATQDARKRLDDLERRIATLESAVASVCGGGVRAVAIQPTTANPDAIPTLRKTTIKFDLWTLTCGIKPEEYKWVEGWNGSDEPFCAFRFNSPDCDDVWKNGELSTIEPPVYWRPIETDVKDVKENGLLCKSLIGVVYARIGFAYYGEAPKMVDALKPIVVERIPNSLDEMKTFDALATQTLLEEDFKNAGIDEARIINLAYHGAKALEDIVDLTLRLNA